MLWVTFLLTNLHFAVMLLGVVTSIILAYVFYSSGKAAARKQVIARSLGFLILAIYLGAHAWGGVDFGEEVLVHLIRFFALTLIAVSFYTDPVIEVPKASLLVLPAALASSLVPTLSIFVLGAIVFRVYRKYSEGLEREFKNFHRGLVLFALFELFHSLEFLKGSSNVWLAGLAGTYGLFWILAHLFLFAAFVYLLIYSWGYLRFQLFNQIFGLFVISTLVVFVVVGITYTFLLIRQMQGSAEDNLRTNLSTFGYSINRLREQGLATAKLIASDQEIAGSISDEQKLSQLIEDEIITSGVDFLAILDKSGKVIGRGEGYEATGASMSGNFVVANALKGSPKTSLTTREWVSAPLVMIEVATPASYGVVYTGYILDSAFVDGYKSATGLETSIYAGDVKSATTFVAPDGVSRLVGAKQTSTAIKSSVLEKGAEYLGLSSVFSNEYVSAYGPFKEEEGRVLGMFFVGIPSSEIFEAAEVSLNTTFYATIILAVLSFIPAYFFARFIERNQV